MAKSIGELSDTLVILSADRLIIRYRYRGLSPASRRKRWLSGLGMVERRARANFDRRPTHAEAGYQNHQHLPRHESLVTPRKSSTGTA